jgi:uncharacterized membrane protein YccF (DUF307 family)
MRNLLNVLGNIIWLVFGGLLAGLAWWLVGVLAYASIVGIPWGRACFVLGRFHFWPFGREAIRRDDLYGRADIGTGRAGTCTSCRRSRASSRSSAFRSPSST